MPAGFKKGREITEFCMKETKNPIVERKKVVTIEYTLKDEQGNIMEDKNTLTYLHGFKNIVPGLEEALDGKKIGDTLTVAVPPEKGYGIRDENMVFTLPKENFMSKVGDDDELNEVQKDIKVGMEFETAIDDVPYILTVIKVDDKGVTVDANHPLAGKALFFDVKVTDIKEALSDELVQGFPMAPEDR